MVTPAVRRKAVAHLVERAGGNSGVTSSALSSLGTRKLESTVKYLGVEVDDAIAISEQVDL